MKLSYHLILAGSLILITGCPQQPTPGTDTRQINDPCDKTNGCMPGLICEDGLCRKVCTDVNDCPDDSNYSCQDGRCVKNTTAAPRKEGESCNDNQLCATGLDCQNGICKKPCTGKNDCLDGEICQNGKCIPEEKLPERGEPCTAQGKCKAGLTCIEQICQKECTLDEDCGDPALICDKKICADKPDTPIGPSGREEAKMGPGGLLTPVSGLVTGSRFKVRVMGGAVQGQIANEQNSARIDSGAWKKEE